MRSDIYEKTPSTCTCKRGSYKVQNLRMQDVLCRWSISQGWHTCTYIHMFTVDLLLMYIIYRSKFHEHLLYSHEVQSERLWYKMEKNTLRKNHRNRSKYDTSNNHIHEWSLSLLDTGISINSDGVRYVL